MKAAACSCRVRTSWIEDFRKDSTTSRFSSPGTPKIRSTPSFSSAATNRSEPLGIVTSGDFSSGTIPDFRCDLYVFRCPNRRQLCAVYDLAHQSDGLLDHGGRDVEMGAGADTAVHHGQQHAALPQRLDHLVAADAGTIRLEEHQIGFGLLHLDAVDLRQPARQCPRIGVIVGEAVDVMVERVDA